MSRRLRIARGAAAFLVAVTGLGLSASPASAETVPSTVTLDAMPAGVTYGDSTTVTATASVPGQIQFMLDGAPLGDPVATDGTSPSTSPTLSRLTAGDHVIGASLTPTDSATDAPSTAPLATLTIDVAHLVITASSASVVRGSHPATVTPSYTGFVNGDIAASLTTAPACSTPASSTSPPGTYATSCAGAADPNYAISYVDGTQTVGTATLTITAPTMRLAYGAPTPVLRPTYAGFVPGDTSASLHSSPTCTTTRRGASRPGAYPTTCSGAAATDYRIRYVAGSITVVRATPRLFGAWRSGMVQQGQREVVTVRVIASNGVVPTGVVHVHVNGRVWASATLSRGWAVITLPPMPRGRDAVDVVYLGSAVVTPLIGAQKVVYQLPLPAGASPPCTSTRGAFTPRQAWVSGLGFFPVVPVGNDGGSMGSPPTSGIGLYEFGWYIHANNPGSGSGGVAIDAHTWYGHDILGTRLLARLWTGGKVILYDASGWSHTCYTVTVRHEYPVAQVPVAAMTVGPSAYERLSIMVCSGTRTVINGVAYYSRRTVWFATAKAP